MLPSPPPATIFSLIIPPCEPPAEDLPASPESLLPADGPIHAPPVKPQEQPQSTPESESSFPLSRRNLDWLRGCRGPGCDTFASAPGSLHLSMDDSPTPTSVTVLVFPRPSPKVRPMVWDRSEE